MEVCQTAVSEVIQLCEEVASVASPVVCNSSPEGFLPGTKVNTLSQWLDLYYYNAWVYVCMHMYCVWSGCSNVKCIIIIT